MKNKKTTKKTATNAVHKITHNVEKIKSIPQTKNQNQYSKKYYFKRYKKKEQGAKHPKLITNTIVENGIRKHVFMGFTESEYSGHHKNIGINNPKTNDTRPAFLRKEQRKDKITNFEDLNNYQLHIEDELKVDSYLNKKKK